MHPLLIGLIVGGVAAAMGMLAFGIVMSPYAAIAGAIAGVIATVAASMGAFMG